MMQQQGIIRTRVKVISSLRVGWLWVEALSLPAPTPGTVRLIDEGPRELRVGLVPTDLRAPGSTLWMVWRCADREAIAVERDVAVG